MFILIISIISISLFFNFLKIRKYAKHDFYLYKFCALRRNIMTYLMVNQDVISKAEYKSIKQLVEVLNKTIHLYSKEEAATIFNFRKFGKYVKNTKGLVDALKKASNSQNKTINDFRNELNRDIVAAFFAHTPFLFEEVCLKLLYAIVSGLIKIGLGKLSNVRNKLLIVSRSFNGIDSYRREFAN